MRAFENRLEVSFGDTSLVITRTAVAAAKMEPVRTAAAKPGAAPRAAIAGYAREVRALAGPRRSVSALEAGGPPCRPSPGNAAVISGDCSSLFECMLHTTHAGTVYIGEDRVPPHSVGFWRPRSDLGLDGEGKRYRTTFGIRDVAIKYVGEAPAIPVIPAGSLVRVSLARWFAPGGAGGWEACWLQVSSWYPASHT